MIASHAGIILVVESDRVLGQVLGRSLSREGLTVVHAANPAEALQRAEQSMPQLVLLDCGLREGNGLDLAEELHARYPSLPLLVLTDYPLRGYDDPARVSGFARVLSKSVGLHDLREAVDAALGEGKRQVQPRRSRREQLLALMMELPMRVFLAKFIKTVGGIVGVLLVLAGVGMMVGMLPVPWQMKADAGEQPQQSKAATEGVELVEGQPHTLSVPEEVRKALGIRKGNTEMIAIAKLPTQTRPLVMPGSTMLDPTRLYRIRARFAPSPSSAEVIEIAQVPEDPAHSGKSETAFRELRSGDWVKKNDLLAVFQSVDVGNKKNDLIDAIYQRELDEEILSKAEAHSEVVPEAFLLNARRNVLTDINSINRAISTLRSWGIPETDIQAVKDEAEQVKKRKGKHDPAKDALWARVEIRAPDDGVIVERNVSLHEIVADNTTNLFQIAKVDRLFVAANVPEDDLPLLQSLPTAKRRWTVKTVGSDPIAGFIDDISYIIEPNQHTALVKGHIENKDNKLVAGQFIAATVDLPPPPDVVEVPVDAVVDDGQQCIVFVQSDTTKPQYTMRRVELAQRFDKTVFVRSKPFPKNEQRTAEEEELGILPKEPLRPGERVLQTGVGELKAALLDKEESQPNKGP
jgi:cobalt-zinc-cadmium efflux system membrane fusion protein